MSFEARLRTLRRRKGLRQIDVAKHLGITESAYGYYEQGRREPSNETLQALAELFDVSTDYLLSGKTGAVQEIDPEWLELYEQVKSLGVELEAKAFLRTTTRESVSKDVLKDVLKVFQHIASQQAKKDEQDAPE